MPASKKDLRKKKQYADAKAGIVATPKKAENTFAICTACKLQVRTTKKNIEVMNHWIAKHKDQGKSLAECFPGETFEDQD